MTLLGEDAGRAVDVAEGYRAYDDALDFACEQRDQARDMVFRLLAICLLLGVALAGALVGLIISHGWL